MGDNIRTIIDHAMDLSDNLDIHFSLHYSKDQLGFVFYKNDKFSKIKFTSEEISEIYDVLMLCERLTNTVYRLLDEVTGRKEG